MNIVMGTAAEWAAATGRILLMGQLGYESTTDVLKVGDGASAWSALPAVGASGGAVWGAISGTLSAQADLQAALDAKVDIGGDTMTGLLVTAAPATDAGLRLTPGAADPSSPADGDFWRRTTDMRARIGGASYTFAFLNGASTFTGKKTFNPSTSGGAFFNLSPGVAPSAPVDGDIWTEAGGVFAQVSGVTKQLDAAGGGGSPAMAWVI